MIIKPVTTEKAIKLIELENIIAFIVDSNDSKSKIKKYIEKMFDVKVDRVNTITKNSKKVAYVKINKKNHAIDIATKLGVI